MFAYTHIRTCLTIKNVFFTALHDTNIYSCLGSASCTKYQKIQNDRKYKHQFVFQVYNILFTKIGRGGRVCSPIFSPGGGGYFASSEFFYFLTILKVEGEFLQNSIHQLEAGEAGRWGGGRAEEWQEGTAVGQRAHGWRALNCLMHLATQARFSTSTPDAIIYRSCGLVRALTEPAHQHDGTG